MTAAEPFARSLSDLNGFVFPRAVLRYQQEILDRGNFSVASPWTGESLAPTVCHVVNNGDPAHGTIGIAYRLDCAPAIWLLAGSIKDGFPLTEAYLPSEDTSLWSLGHAYELENRSWKTRLQALEVQYSTTAMPTVKPQRSTLLLGHPNFAHNLWNELPAVEAYLDANRGAVGDEGALQVKAIYEPLVPIQRFARDGRLEVTRIDNFDDLVGFQLAMATRLGATQIPGELRQKVIGLLWEQRDRALIDPLIQLLQRSDPVVWLTVRLDARTLDNQEELLLSLIQRIAAEYPAAAFVLDGFSYPNDFDHPVYRQPGAGPWQALCARFGRSRGFLGGVMVAREREIRAYTREVQARLEQSISNAIVNATGMNLANAISLAGTSDYYVSHAGTLQHKIAWLYNIPGTVHSNTAGLAKGVRGWLAGQLEGGVKPQLVSKEYVEDLGSIRTANKVERNRDYHIRDVASVVEEIMDDLQVSLDVASPQ